MSTSEPLHPSGFSPVASSSHTSLPFPLPPSRGRLIDTWRRPAVLDLPGEIGRMVGPAETAEPCRSRPTKVAGAETMTRDYLVKVCVGSNQGGGGGGGALCLMNTDTGSAVETDEGIDCKSRSMCVKLTLL